MRRAYAQTHAPHVGVATALAALATLASACGGESSPAPTIGKADIGLDGSSGDASADPDVDTAVEPEADAAVDADADSADDATADTTTPPCQSDKHCVATGAVCHLSSGLCVECLTSADCLESYLCKGMTCRLPGDACTSSKDCPKDQVCHKQAGECVACEADADCGQGTVCFQTVCVVPQLAGKVCTASETRCEADGKLGTCAADGSQFVAAPCAANHVCVAGACKAQVCAPGAKGCDGAKTTLCAADGLSAAVVEDCGASGLACLGGACKSLACTVPDKTCKDVATALTCVAGAWQESACGEGKTCLDGACVTKLCTPGAKSCKGAEVAVCDATGTTLVPGEDCDNTGKICQGGACVSKQSGFGASGGFVSVPESGAGGGYRVQDQGFRLGMSCGAGYCQTGGFR